MPLFWCCNSFHRSARELKSSQSDVLMGRSFSQNFRLLTQIGQKLKIKNWWAVAFNVKCILWLFKNVIHSYMYSSALCGIVSICIGVILRNKCILNMQIITVWVMIFWFFTTPSSIWEHLNLPGSTWKHPGAPGST